jgi:pyridoxamine-phosphate oxidase
MCRAKSGQNCCSKALEGEVQDPLALFKDWFQDAGEKDRFANSVTLATVSEDCQPAARMVLLKGFSTEGFTFYTNYNSRKAQELDRTPKAALCFYWRHLNRSVRVEGSVVRVAGEESDEYFQSRPRGSQLGAWCSAQSSEIPSRQV